MAGAESTLRSTQPLPDGYWGLLAGVTVFIIVVQIVLQTVLAIGAGDATAATAHEKAAAQRATRNAYWILITGVMATIGSTLFNLTPFVMGSVLLVTFVAAEIVRLFSQLIYSRAS